MVDDPYILGFTGSRHGGTTKQKATVFALLSGWRELHHGDCIGWDRLMHNMALGMSLHVMIHPPLDPSLRAYCQGGHVFPEKGYLERNKDIVDVCHHLLAAPDTDVEQRRSGTWSTIRYARKLGKPLTIVYPDGSRQVENIPLRIHR